MTDTKRKAIELVHRFKEPCGHFLKHINITEEDSKQCAIICCQEIIDLIECFSESEQTIEFYESVKEEITKM